MVIPRSSSQCGRITTSSSASDSTNWSSVVPSTRAIVTIWSSAMRRWPVSIRLSVEGLIRHRPASSSSDQPRASRRPRIRCRTTASKSSSCFIRKMLCQMGKVWLRLAHGT